MIDPTSDMQQNDSSDGAENIDLKPEEQQNVPTEDEQNNVVV
jgi:hypothetical protein